MQKWALTAAVLLGAAFLFAAGIAAESPKGSTSPLFAFRMEQVSSEMNFLPLEKNSFVYNTEKGCQIGSSPSCGNCSNVGAIFITYKATCWYTCDGTCGYTCVHTCNTCWYTCDGTCSPTCLRTCNTCWYTCDGTCMFTCLGTCNTCWYTCDGTCSPTCLRTCNTCWWTCDGTCSPTCVITCGSTCLGTCWAGCSSMDICPVTVNICPGE